MFRAFLILGTFVLVLGAQDPQTVPSPVEVTGKISSVDSQTSPEFGDKPGLFMTIKNVSSRDIQAYTIEAIFTDPQTGTRIEHQTHSARKLPTLGPLITAGAQMEGPKPYSAPRTAAGSDAKVSFNIDLVVFEDGTTWGPGNTRAAKELIARVQGAPSKRR